MKTISLEQETQTYYLLKDLNFKYVNDMVNGFREGELITIAARSGCGKSTIGRNIIVNFNQQGITTLLVSSEETEFEIGPKIKKISNEFRVGFNTKRFYLEDEEFTIDKIEADIKKSKAKIVLIDYIQQLDGNIKDNTKALKRLAMKYKCIIFIFSQLNRMAAGRIPDTSMLSKSDNILHDSDQVWLLHNTELKTIKEGYDGLMLDVAKNRKGKIGKTWLSFDKENGVIYDVDPKFWKQSESAFKRYLENKYPTWAKKIVDSINSIETPRTKMDKPFMVLKTGIII